MQFPSPSSPIEKSSLYSPYLERGSKLSKKNGTRALIIGIIALAIIATPIFITSSLVLSTIKAIILTVSSTILIASIILIYKRSLSPTGVPSVSTPEKEDKTPKLEKKEEEIIIEEKSKPDHLLNLSIERKEKKKKLDQKEATLNQSKDQSKLTYLNREQSIENPTRQDNLLADLEAGEEEPVEEDKKDKVQYEKQESIVESHSIETTISEEESSSEDESTLNSDISKEQELSADQSTTQEVSSDSSSTGSETSSKIEESEENSSTEIESDEDKSLSAQDEQQEEEELVDLSVIQSPENVDKQQSNEESEITDESLTIDNSKSIIIEKEDPKLTTSQEEETIYEEETLLEVEVEEKTQDSSSLLRKNNDEVAVNFSEDREQDVSQYQDSSVESNVSREHD